MWVSWYKLAQTVTIPEPYGLSNSTTRDSFTTSGPLPGIAKCPHERPPARGVCPLCLSLSRSQGTGPVCRLCHLPSVDIRGSLVAAKGAQGIVTKEPLFRPLLLADCALDGSRLAFNIRTHRGDGDRDRERDKDGISTAALQRQPQGQGQWKGNG